MHLVRLGLKNIDHCFSLQPCSHPQALTSGWWSNDRLRIGWEVKEAALSIHTGHCGQWCLWYIPSPSPTLPLTQPTLENKRQSVTWAFAKVGSQIVRPPAPCKGLRQTRLPLLEGRLQILEGCSLLFLFLRLLLLFVLLLLDFLLESVGVIDCLNLGFEEGFGTFHSLR